MSAFSILILTRDEESNLPACLDSIRWCDDVVVLDSGSTDRTVELARSAGCRVFEHPFADFAAQRNYGLDHIAFHHPWVFHLDADERFTPELRSACEAAAAGDSCSGYLVPGRMMFRGRWLRRAAAYPVYQMRFMKRGEVRFVQVGHGQREGASRRGLGRLTADYVHEPFAKGLDDWWRKHERYAADEARQIASEPPIRAIDWRDALAGADPLTRRRALKRIAGTLPFRGGLRFLHLYVIRMGFLDGAPGFAYARLMARYESRIARLRASSTKSVA